MSPAIRTWNLFKVEIKEEEIEAPAVSKVAQMDWGIQNDWVIISLRRIFFWVGCHATVLPSDPYFWLGWDRMSMYVDKAWTVTSRNSAHRAPTSAKH